MLRAGLKAVENLGIIAPALLRERLINLVEYHIELIKEDPEKWRTPISNEKMYIEVLETFYNEIKFDNEPKRDTFGTLGVPKEELRPQPKAEQIDAVRERNNGPRPLRVIAKEIQDDWGTKVKYSAKPYLDAMRSLEGTSDSYGCDSGESVVRYFLANAGTWRGETARRVKAELKAMLS